MRVLSTTLLAAQNRFIRAPVLQALIGRPGYPDAVFDMSRYVTQATVVLPPNFAAGYVQMTLANGTNSITGNPLFHPDYQLDLRLGYRTAAGVELTTIGRFWLDEPQREFTVNPAKDEVVLQARDGVKILMERQWTVDEWIDVRGVSVRDAIQQTVGYATIAGQTLAIVFDDDADTVAALDEEVLEETAQAGDSNGSVYALLKSILSTAALQAYFTTDGILRVGMMHQQEPIAVTVGGVTALARPVFQRNHRRSGREHFNWVHVEGDRVFADAFDQANIDDIGRVKYKFIDDPEISDQDKAVRRAQQELMLTSRFREQPDMIVPWMLDLERRDLIYVDDAGASGLAPGTYRVEDLRYLYQAGSQPDATLQLGLGLPFVGDVSTTAGGF